MRTGNRVAMALVLVLGAMGCDQAPLRRDPVLPARFPVALAATGDGGLLYGERVTGNVRRIDPDGRRRDAPMAHVDVSTDGQRGLLGIATAGDALYASFTEAGGERHIVVARLLPTYAEVWRGPPSRRLANGGHLAWDRGRRRIVVGIGDLQAHRLVDEPTAVNGKLLLLDPTQPPDQRPQVLSAGWNNPFAFTVLADDSVWVADNIPGEVGERLARGDRRGRPTQVRRLPRNTVPAALAALGPDQLLLCSFANEQLTRYRIDGTRPERTGGPIHAPRCATGVALTDGVVWTATPRALHHASVRAVSTRLDASSR